jgi:hypothetical protein
MASVLDEDVQNRFFSDHAKTEVDEVSSAAEFTGVDLPGSEQNSDEDSNDGHAQKCLTIRICQYICPCLKRRSLWNTSDDNIFKINEVKETKYPRILTILEHPAFDILQCVSAFLSIYLLLFCEGFLVEETLLWGIIHGVNAVYTFCVFCEWLEILLKSKYAKTNQGYGIRDVVLSFISVLPLDIIFLVGYVWYSEKQRGYGGLRNPHTPWLTPARINYLLRFRSVLKYFSQLEDELSVGKWICKEPIQ